MTVGRFLAVGGTVLLIAVVFAATNRGNGFSDYVPSVERFYTRWIPPASPQVDDKIAPLEVDALTKLGHMISGRLVWSSNRGGNHDLYLAELSTGSVRRLTDHPHVDYFSRFSPDGKQISFLRSRSPWVSFREQNEWDLYLMNADGTDARRLVEHAYHPTWDPSGSGFVFLRENKIFYFDLTSGREQLIQDGETPPLEGRLNDPELAADGRIAVTIRRREQLVGVLDTERETWEPVSTSQSCHITWVPGEDRVLWIDGQGHGGTRVMHGRPGVVGGEVLIDLPGEHSHEYFPRVTADREWLVWGATAAGHEHDRADYEIFVWRFGMPWTSAVRITHSTANDQWPDLFIDISSQAVPQSIR